MLFTALLAFLTVCHVKSSVFHNCNPCQCYEKLLNCRARSLTSIPPMLYRQVSQIEIMDLRDNYLSVQDLSAIPFSSMGRLKNILVSQNADISCDAVWIIPKNVTMDLECTRGKF